jgi:cytochrome P450
MMELLPKLPAVPLPGPRAVPLLGAHANVMRFFGDPVGVLLALHREYGELASLIAGNPAWVAAFGPRYNQQVLSDVRLFHNYSDIPQKVPEDSAPMRLNNGALTALNGDVHRRVRRLVMPAFSRPAVATYRDEMVKVAERVLVGWKVGETRNVSSLMMELTLCVAMQCLYGVDVSRQADELGTLSQSYLGGMLSVGAMLLPVRLPGLPYARFLDVAERFERRILQLIAERRAHPSAGRDVLSLLVQARDEDGSTLTDKELEGQVAILLIASHETTSHTLSWTLFLLSQHPEVLGALVEELDAKLGGAAPTLEQLAQLPLLDAVVKESMRLLPATPFLFFRRATGSFELGPYTLPEKATLLLSPLVTHRDPALYPEPLRFRPERWKTLSPGTYEYLPFGAGPRMCIGASFATMALRVLLALLVQRFRFTLAPQARISRLVRGITLGPKHGLPMRIDAQDRRFAPPGPVRGDIHELVQLPVSA